MTTKTNKSTPGTFYDIHLHAFNLGHAGILSFVNRFVLNNKMSINDLSSGKYIQLIFRMLFLSKSSDTTPTLKKLKNTTVLAVLWLLAIDLLSIIVFTILLMFSFKWTSILIKISLFIFGCYAIVGAFFLIKNRYFKKKRKGGIINTLSIFDNTIDRQFIYLEMDYLRFHPKINDIICCEKQSFYNRFSEIANEWSKNSAINIAGNEYSLVVLTPLMMDFGYKGMGNMDKSITYYNLAPKKSVVDQVIDLYYGIKEYMKESPVKLFEIYPFLGINPSNYNLGASLNMGAFKKKADIKNIKISQKLEKYLMFVKKTETLVFFRQIDNKEMVWDVYNWLSEYYEGIDESLIFKLNEDEKLKNDENNLPKMLYKYFSNYQGNPEDFRKVFNVHFGKFRLLDKIFKSDYNNDEEYIEVFQVANNLLKEYKELSESVERNNKIPIESEFMENIRKLTQMDKSNYKTFMREAKYLIKLDIDHEDIRSNFFAGIKVYPPLGFDPWPEKFEEDIIKVNLLYQYCCERNIPVTTHCSDAGFVVIDKKEDWKISSPSHWKQVLNVYPDLKLNFAHFGVQLDKYFKGWGEWQEEIILMLLNSKYKNVYADFSDISYDNNKYRDFTNSLKSVLKKNNKSFSDVENKVLFGTDFMVNLFGIDSYYQYLFEFHNTNSFVNQFNFSDKNKLCEKNPSNFLFR